MMEIKYQPIKQLVILELVHMNLDNYIDRCVVINQSWETWVNGMIVDIDTMRSCDEKYRNFLQGIEMFERVTFVKFPKYANKIKWSSGHYEVPVIDYSGYPSYVELSEWIKKQPIWNQNPLPQIQQETVRVQKLCQHIGGKNV